MTTARILISVVVLMSSILLAEAVNCRKYAFAPACRGMMIKRGDHQSLRTTTTLADTLASEYGNNMVEFLLQLQNSVEQTKSLLNQVVATGCSKIDSPLESTGGN